MTDLSQYSPNAADLAATECRKTLVGRLSKTGILAFSFAILRRYESSGAGNGLGIDLERVEGIF